MRIFLWHSLLGNVFNAYIFINFSPTIQLPPKMILEPVKEQEWPQEI